MAGSVAAVSASAAAVRHWEVWRRCWQRGGGGADSKLAAAGLAAAEEVW